MQTLNLSFAAMRGIEMVQKAMDEVIGFPVNIHHLDINLGDFFSFNDTFNVRVLAFHGRYSYHLNETSNRWHSANTTGSDFDAQAELLIRKGSQIGGHELAITLRLGAGYYRLIFSQVRHDIVTEHRPKVCTIICRDGKCDY